MSLYTIDVENEDVKIIKYIATRTGRNPVKMIEELIRQWAKGQLEGYFMDKIRGKSTQELIKLLGDIK